RVGTRTDGHHPEFRSRLDDRIPNLVVVLIRSPYFQSRSSGHPVAKCSHLFACYRHRGHVEESELLKGTAVEFFDDAPRFRSLDLKAVVASRDGFAIGSRRRTTVDFDVQVRIPSCLAVIEQPIGGRSATDVDIFFLGFVEEYAVADHMTRR